MNINRLFQYLNDRHDHLYLEFTDRGIKFHSKDPKLDQKDRFDRILKKWSLFKNLTSEEQKRINPEGLAYTAGVVRDIYHRIIVENLRGKDLQSQLLMLASNAHYDLSSRVAIVEEKDELHAKIQDVWFESIPANYQQTRETIEHYITELAATWGENRVDRALDRCHIDFLAKIQNGDRFLLREVKAIQLALFEVYEPDVYELYEKIMSFISDDIANPFSQMEKASIEHEFGMDFKEKLEKIFSTQTPYANLNAFQIDLLIRILRPREGKEDLAYGGRRIEGVISGHQENNSFRLDYILERETQERLQMFQTMRDMMKHVQPEELEHAYDEYLVKTVAKKTLPEGVLIPAPNNQWYVVGKRIYPGEGKIAYYLKPFPKNNQDLPDRLIYRSTSSNPYQLDSAGTVLTDINPSEPPGYFGGRGGIEDEMKIIFQENRDLKIIGHSLGSSYAQLTMIHAMQYQQKSKKKLPNKKIKMVCFAAPAIKKSDSKAFAKWYSELPNRDRISLEYHFSKPDIVPGSGDVHLGYGCKDIDLSFNLLDAVDDSLPELKLHPHGRFYYLAKPEIDYSREKGGVRRLEAFDDEPWRKRVESLRHGVGTFAFPFLNWTRDLKKWLFEDSRENPTPKIIQWMEDQRKEEQEKAFVRVVPMTE